MPKPLEIFFSYAHEDEDLMNDVRRQLVVFERNGRIVKWHDRRIVPGADWRQQIDWRLERADIVLLFVTPHFIESRYCYEVEGQAALRRHSTGEARVIPIILRPCSWQDTPFANLQVLPRDGRPVSRWDDRDEACLEVARALMDVVDELTAAGTRRGDEPAPAIDPNLPMLADTESAASLPPIQCTSANCRSKDVDLTDGVLISALAAGADGWSVRGVVRADYSIEGHCRTCGRIFEVVKRQIPVQFPELVCNECDRSAFLRYRVQELKRVEGGYEFAVDIRCSGCQGFKRVTQLLRGLLHTVGIRVGVDGLDVQKERPT